MSRSIPIVQERNWQASLVHVAVLVATVAIGWRVAGWPMGVLVGALAYLTYSRTSRALLAADHRRGVRLIRDRQWEAGLLAFQSSYRHFSAHPWIDRWRALALLSDSAASYREMALVNVAFCLSQLGRGPEAKIAYERAAQEFPDSPTARAALALIATLDGSPSTRKA
jgi:hypothetical protein